MQAGTGAGGSPSKLQFRLKVPADGLDPHVAVVVEQPGAVQDGDRADVVPGNRP